jgi:Ni/Co efflux regulator RcnB
MNKFLSVLFASLFAVGSTAALAQDKKADAKKEDTKAAEAKKDDTKSADAKTAKKDETKKKAKKGGC